MKNVLRVVYCVLLALPLVNNGAILPPERSYEWGKWIWRPPASEGRPVHAAFTAQAPPSVSTLNAAIGTCPPGSVIEFDVGTYAMNGEIALSRSGVLLRGKRGQRVVFSNRGGAGSSMLRISAGHPDDFSGATAYDVSSGFLKGSTNLTTVSLPSQFAVDDIIQIDQLEDDPLGLVDASGNSGHCNWCGRQAGYRTFSQTLRVLAIQGNSITFEPPLAMSFQPSQSIQVIEHRNVVRNSGVENISFDNGGSARDTVVIQGGYRTFLKDCSLTFSRRRHVWIFGGMQNAFVGTSFRSGEGPDWSSGYTSDRAYGLLLGQNASFTLVEDCIFEKLSYPIAMEGASMGSVIGYNFCTNVQNNTLDTPKPFTGNHGAHQSMVLVEGNWSAARISMDAYWGSSSHWAFLRNRAFIVPMQAGVPVSQYWVVFDVWKNNVFHSAIGNLFGTVGVENRLDVGSGESVNSGTVVKAIRRLGNQNANHTSWSGYDPEVRATLLWHGNWLSFPAGLQYDPAIADRTIPASLYLTARPAFQGNLPWPSHDPMNPALASAVNLAAGHRFYYGTNPPAGGTVPPVIPPVIPPVTNPPVIIPPVTNPPVVVPPVTNPPVIIPPTGSVPGRVANLAGVVANDGNLTLTWTARPEWELVTSYSVKEIRNGQPVPIITVTAPTLMVLNLSAGGHIYQVCAVNAAGIGEMSGVLSVNHSTPLQNVPVAPVK